MPIRKVVKGGLDILLAEMKKLDQNSAIYILFCGAKNEKGESWCPDCRVAEPHVDKAMAKLKDDAVFIYCDVGPRDEWKSPSNPFRVHKDFKLTAVPTLIKWKTAKRLVEGECADAGLLEMMTEEDTK